jgi:hypothetical protein
MADKKISQLTAASTPLAGTEVLPIVQSGSTVKVAVSDLTAGRNVGCADLTTTGNTILGNAQADTLNVGNGDIIKNNAGYTGFGTTPSYKVHIVESKTITPTTGEGQLAVVNSSATATDVGALLMFSQSTRRAQISAGKGAGTNDGFLAFTVRTDASGFVETARTDESLNFKINAGNLVVGTAAKGIQDGSNVDRISIASASTVVNESGADLDFRVEGDTNANLLFVDAGNDRVGIRTSTPNTPLEVVGGGGIRVDEDGTSTNVIVVRSDFAGVGPAINVVSNSPLLFQTNNTERARITATGNIVAGASVALATNASDGFLYVPTCAGTPTGTPTTITGMAPIVVDTTNNKLYFYSGGQWRDAGP